MGLCGIPGLKIEAWGTPRDSILIDETHPSRAWMGHPVRISL